MFTPIKRNDLPDKAAKAKVVKARLDTKKAAIKTAADKGNIKAGPLEEVLSKKVSKRTFLKGTLAAGAVVGVSAMAAKSPIGPLQAVSSYPGVQIASSVVLPTSAPSVDPFAPQNVSLNVNGTNYSVSIEPRAMLANVLRDDLGLIGTKMGCNRMSCGACTVLIDGLAHEACQFPAYRAVGHAILTVEGGVPAQAPTSKVAADPIVVALQNAWVANDGGQCAFCGPGMIMAAAQLLKTNTNPTVDQIKATLSGNLCRCGNYLNIIASVQAAATALGGA
jgi:aerobic-type carbon monoxide dehydrogenase small subunit (CoxS/CutS family)